MANFMVTELKAARRPQRYLIQTNKLYNILETFLALWNINYSGMGYVTYIPYVPTVMSERASDDPH